LKAGIPREEDALENPLVGSELDKTPLAKVELFRELELI
jgi:hypothetical protein